MCGHIHSNEIEMFIVTISYSFFQLSRTLSNEVYLNIFIYTFISDTSRIRIFIVPLSRCCSVKKVDWSEPIIYLSLDTCTYHNLTCMTAQPFDFDSLLEDMNIYRSFSFALPQSTMPTINTLVHTWMSIEKHPVRLLLRCEHISLSLCLGLIVNSSNDTLWTYSLEMRG